MTDQHIADPPDSVLVDTKVGLDTAIEYVVIHMEYADRPSLGFPLAIDTAEDIGRKLLDIAAHARARKS